MLVFGTQMHIVTFLFVCIEAAILFYLVIYKLARPDDVSTGLNIALIILLLIYNITGGFLPDSKLPGSFLLQESIAYGTGFITPCYFPYYVYKGLRLKRMHFHAFKGVLLFLTLPYFLFATVLFITANLNAAKNILAIPVGYALWVLYDVWKAVGIKYAARKAKGKSIEEIVVLFISLSSWVGLPFITYFNLSQAIEAITTNTGFLLLFALHLKRNIEQLREEHRRLIESEKSLLDWNRNLQSEVEKRTRELERIKLEERILQNCRLYNLTNRESEVAGYMCKGNTYKEIAATLFIAERTVAKHVQNIFEKVNINNKLELCKKLEAPARCDGQIGKAV